MNFEDGIVFSLFFYLSEGVQMYPEAIEPSLLPLMLTNIEGSRSYAVGLKFTRPFFIESVSSLNQVLNVNSKFYETVWLF